jgi:hypothetical protein
MNKIKYIIIAVIFLIGLTVSADDDLPALKYYISKVDSVLASEYLFNTDTEFSVSVESEYLRTNYRGEIDRFDTASWRMSFRDSKAAEITVIDSVNEDGNTPPDDFTIPPLWNDSCRYFFYPNDTGTGRLSIGFDFDNMNKNGLVSGLCSFNRDSHLMQTLILYYVDTGIVDHMSRVYKFGSVDSRPVIEGLEIHWKKGTLLGREYYRRKLHFYDYDLR